MKVSELGRSVFVIRAEAFKTKRSHVVILNDVAWSIIKSQRGKHPVGYSRTATSVDYSTKQI